MINLNDDVYEIPSKEELLHKYSDYDIFKHYIGDFELGATIRSPLRRGDEIPSFSIFYSKKNGCLLFKDFAGKRGDCIVFVQYLLGLATYNDAIKQIFKDMGNSISVISKPKVITTESKASCDLRIVVRPWNDADIEFWKQFGISLVTLNHYNVVPIKGYYYEEHYIVTYGLSYAYLEYKDDKLTYKIYRPTADKKNKWRNNNPFGVHQGYRQLPFSGDLLIITKSLKDVMSIWENTNIPAIGVQSESCYIKDTVIDEYKFRFDRVVTLFDNDRQGVQQAKSYEELYDIPAIFIPLEDGVKDFTDLVKKIGRHEAIIKLKLLLFDQCMK